MKHVSILAALTLIGAGAITVSMRAQGAAAGPADQAWANLSVLAKPTALARAVEGKPKTPAQLNAEIKQQAARYRQTAQSAREFYTTHSGHPKAGEARKLEALAAIRGVEAGNAAHEQVAFDLGKAFRENAVNPIADRFEVALAMDRLDLSLQIKSRKARGRPEDWKAVGDKLKPEFGAVPALYTYYMDIARTLDAATAAKLAAEVNAAAAAPMSAKAQAKAILDREGLVGKTVSAKLTTVDAAPLDLGAQKGKVTVVLAWSPSDTSPLANLKRFEKSLPSDTQVIYLAMGGTAAQVTRGKAEAVVPGIHCHAPTGPLARAANDGLKLQYSRLPRAYVLNRSGVLVGYGKVEDLPALMIKAGG